MKTTFINQEWPSMRSFIVGATEEEFCKGVRQSGEVDVYVSLHTKTTLYIQVQKGNANFKVGFIPQGCEDMKFHTKEEYSFFDYKTHTHNYLKMTKAQGMECLKRYLTALFDGMFSDMEELKVNLYIKNEVKERIAA